MILRPNLKKAFLLLGICSILLSACSSVNAIIEPATATPKALATLAPGSFATVQLGDVIKSIDYSGRVVSLSEQPLQFQTSGRIAKLDVKQGDVVKQGQLLAELDSQVSDFDLRKAQIALDKADLLYKQIQVNTPKTQKDYAMIVGLKKADVDLAQVELDQLNARVAASKLTAPSDGVISKISILENTTVDLSKPAMVLSDPAQLEISGVASDPSAAKLVEKLPVTVSLLNKPGTAEEGFIRLVTFTSGSSSSTQTNIPTVLTTQVSLNGTWPADFQLGNQVTIKAVLDQRPGVLWLPPTALREVNTRQYVVVQNGDKQVQVDVQVGLTTSTQVEITQGLTEGQIVILPK